MRRVFTPLVVGAAAWLLVACGGGSAGDAGDVSSRAAPAAARITKLALPDKAVLERIDSRLRSARGSVDVWVSLDQNSVAAQRAQLAEAAGLTDRKSAQAAGALRAGVQSHRQRVAAQQGSLSSQLTSLGAKELARVQLAHNAIAVRIDASKLKAIAALPGVAKVRPVLTYQMDLSETVPYVGAAKVQASGVDGTGVTVAVLDSGIDYTHRNLGGPGTAAAYEAAYGTSTSDPRTTTRDGLFPTAKVVAGYDFVGEDWPNSDEVADPDPIDLEGHGTHVADIIAGRSTDGSHKGVAPGAKLVAVKVCSAVATSCSGIALLQGMDFALDPNQDGDLSDAVDVINMSLGQSYGQIEDDLTVASINAVRLGVAVVASAGNSADRPYIVGSPSIAPGVISVAQTQVPSAVAIPLTINSPAAIAGTYPNTATVDFAPVGSGFSGEVKLASTASGTSSNLACTALPAGSLAGKVALIDRGTCNVSVKVHNAATAGAIGVLIANNADGDPPTFSFGGPEPFNAAPTLILTRSDGARIKANIAAPVTVTVSPAVSVPLVGGVVASSSRGPSYSFQSIKPEIGAPGASVSAVAGSGTGEEAFGGTSGAAPMVSGAVALIVQAHPTRSPEQIKAMLMNSAETNVYTNPATQPGVLAPVSRIGGGELRVDRAINQTAIAWNRATRSASLSFGALEVTKPMVVEQTLRIQNFARYPKVFSVSADFRYADDEASGAVRVLVQPVVAVGGRDHEDLDVRLVIDPTRLPDWVLNGGANGGNGQLLNGQEFDGYLTLKSGSEKITVPWHVLPRKAADTEAELATNRFGQFVKLRNRAWNESEFDVFSLTGQSARLPRPAPGDPGTPGSNAAVIDMRSVGVRYWADDDAIEFAINTQSRRAHPAYPGGFEVDIDVDGDGNPDWYVFNQENGTFAATGQTLVYVQKAGTNTANAYYYADADLNSGNIILTAPASVMGVTAGKTINFAVLAYDNYFTGNVTDVIDGMRFTPGSPRFQADSGPLGSVPRFGATALRVVSSPVPDSASSEKGLLFMYRRDAGKEADAVPLN